MAGDSVMHVPAKLFRGFLCLIIALLCDRGIQTEGAIPDQPPEVDGTKSKPSSASQKDEKKEEPAPFHVQPYSVLISVAFSGPAFADDVPRQKVMTGLEQSVRRLYGRLFEADIRHNQWMIPGTASHLHRLTTKQLMERYPEDQFQKVFLMTVHGNGTEYRLACREYDSRVHEATAIASTVIRDIRSIGNTCGRLVRDSFRPVLMFVRRFDDEAGRTRVEMQAQGGMILTPDPSAAQVREGDVLRPFRREMERRNPTKLKLLRPFALTYMRVMSVDNEVSQGLAETVFLSHLHPDSFLGKGRATERLALRQRPTAEKSVVRLVLNNRPDKPLISHRLALAYQLTYKDDENGEQTKLLSDRNGEVVIARREKHPTFWIRVYSGTSLLARVPYAPGLLPFDTVKLPDDSVRLGVEGEVQLLSDALIDAIAQREVLIARAKKKAESGEAKVVTELLAQYEKLPGKDYFLEKIKSVETLAALAAAKKRVLTGRQEALCKSFASSVERFFTDEKRTARNQEIQQIKGTAESNSK